MKLLGNKIYRKGRKPKKNAYGSIGNRGRGAETYSSSRCCVHPDSRIAMADGTTKAAKDIKIGDKLKTQAGEGVVEIISNPKLGYRELYSYGRGSYFITGDHPVHANGEWKSLTPKYSKLNFRAVLLIIILELLVSVFVFVSIPRVSSFLVLI